MAVLEIPPDAPALAHAGADVLLYLHIGGGAVGILSGATALLSRKGEPVHRAAGTVFFISMFICYAVAALVAPFLAAGRSANTIAGVLALYLLISGWRTARRPETIAGRVEIAGLPVALAVLAVSLFFIRAKAGGSSIGNDGSPSEAFYLFAFASAFAVAGELHLIARRRLAGVARIARHLWRMCFSLFIASGSFFLGQQQVMPEWMRGSPVLVALALAPLAFMAYFLIRVHLPRGRSERRRAAEAHS